MIFTFTLNWKPEYVLHCHKDIYSFCKMIRPKKKNMCVFSSYIIFLVRGARLEIEESS